MITCHQNDSEDFVDEDSTKLNAVSSNFFDSDDEDVYDPAVVQEEKDSFLKEYFKENE